MCAFLFSSAQRCVSLFISFGRILHVSFSHVYIGALNALPTINDEIKICELAGKRNNMELRVCFVVVVARVVSLLV